MLIIDRDDFCDIWQDIDKKYNSKINNIEYDDDIDNVTLNELSDISMEDVYEKYYKNNSDIDDYELFFFFLSGFQKEQLVKRNKELFDWDMTLSKQISKLKNVQNQSFCMDEYYKFKDKMQNKWNIFTDIDKTRILLMFPEYILNGVYTVKKRLTGDSSYIKKEIIPSVKVSSSYTELNQIEKINCAYAMCIKIQYLLSTESLDGLNMWALVNEYVNDYLNVPMGNYKPIFWSEVTTGKINEEFKMMNTNIENKKMMNKGVEDINDFIELMQQEILMFAYQKIFNIKKDSPKTIEYFNYKEFKNEHFWETTTIKELPKIKETAENIFSYLDANEHIKNVFLSDEDKIRELLAILKNKGEL